MRGYGLQRLGASYHPGYCLLDPRARATYDASGTRRRARPVPTGGTVDRLLEAWRLATRAVGRHASDEPTCMAGRTRRQPGHARYARPLRHGSRPAYCLAPRDLHGRHATQRPMRTTGPRRAAPPALRWFSRRPHQGDASRRGDQGSPTDQGVASTEPPEAALASWNLDALRLQQTEASIRAGGQPVYEKICRLIVGRLHDRRGRRDDPQVNRTHRSNRYGGGRAWPRLSAPVLAAAERTSCR